MQANLGFTAVFLGTIIYVLGNWMGRNHSEEAQAIAWDATVEYTTEKVVNKLIDDGYICIREEEEDGQIVTVLVRYDEYMSNTRYDEYMSNTDK